MFGNEKRFIYLDNHATTLCDPTVIKTMLPYFGEIYGNPSSSAHRAGREGSSAVDKARIHVAALIGTKSREIIFTGGATESNNIALLGLALDSANEKKQILSTPIEHKSIINTVKELKKRGFNVSFLPVDGEGIVDLDEAEKIIDERTLLVSVQAASNEIGTIQPIKELATIAHRYGALMHTDAAQAVGKIPVDVHEWYVDLLSISAHKLYGPKGVGALYIRGGPYALPIKPLLFGGGQEHDLRPGTLNVPGIVGFGEACRLCQEYLPEEAQRIQKLRDTFEEKILNRIDGVKLNGALSNRLPNNSSLTFPGFDAEALIVNCPDLAISTGSACTSGAIEPSHVLLAIGLSRDDADATIRIGLGRFTTEEEIEQAVDSIAEAVERLRRIQKGA